MVLAALKLFECRCSAANYLTFRLKRAGSHGVLAVYVTCFG